MILALETSSEAVSVALLHEDVMLGYSCVGGAHQHDALLVPMMESVLALRNMRAQDLDAVAVSAGPGSFTGLRVGMAAAKALAYTAAKPLILVPTFEAILHWAPGRVKDGPLVLAFRSRAQEIYLSIHEVKGHEVVDVHPLAVEPRDHAVTLVPEASLILGNAAQDLIEAGAPGRSAGFQVSEYCNALMIASLGEEYLKMGRTADPLSSEPLYMHRFATTTPKSLFVS